MRAGEPFNYLLTGRQSPLSILYRRAEPILTTIVPGNALRFYV